MFISLIFKIVDPNKTTVLIHEDLLLYKHVYEQMTVTLKENLVQTKHLEDIIDNLRAENAKFHNLFNNLKASAMKDQKYLISKITLKIFLDEFQTSFDRDKSYSTNYTIGSDSKKTTPLSEKESQSSSMQNQGKIKSSLEEIQEQGELESDVEDEEFTLYSPIANNFPEKIRCMKSIDQTIGLIPALDLSKATNANYKLEKKVFKCKTSRITKKLRQINNQEWEVAIRHAGMTKEDIDQLSRNRLLYKVFEAMMNLNRIIEEKNSLLINSLNKLKILHDEKSKKEQENITLYQSLISMRKEVESLLAASKHPDSTTSQMSKYKRQHSTMNNQTGGTIKYELTDCSMLVNNEITEDKYEDVIIEDELQEADFDEVDGTKTEIR